MTRKAKSQHSQPGKRKGYSDSQSSDERSWLDSPVDTDDITVHVPPPVPVSCSGLQLNDDNIDSDVHHEVRHWQQEQRK